MVGVGVGVGVGFGIGLRLWGGGRYERLALRTRGCWYDARYVVID